MSKPKRPTMFRVGPSFSRRELSTDIEGGKFGAGIIRGVSIVTGGEALGHQLWLDRQFLQQAAAAINRKGNGIKCRFGHPSVLWDGTGTAIGRVMGAVVAGRHVRADVHLLEAAKRSPIGNLTDYVLSLADEAPDLLQISIVFDRDWQAETAFEIANPKSPDRENTKNLPHARLAKVWAADFVDDGASNPGGLFDAPVSKRLPTGATRSENRPAAAPPDSFMGGAHDFAKANGVPLYKAMSAIAERYPGLYEQHINQGLELTALRAEKHRLEIELQGKRMLAKTH